MSSNAGTHFEKQYILACGHYLLDVSALSRVLDFKTSLIPVTRVLVAVCNFNAILSWKAQYVMVTKIDFDSLLSLVHRESGYRLLQGFLLMGAQMMPGYLHFGLKFCRFCRSRNLLCFLGYRCQCSVVENHEWEWPFMGVLVGHDNTSRDEDHYKNTAARPFK